MIRVGMNGVGCGAACVSLDVVVGGWLEFAALYSFAGSGDCALEFIALSGWFAYCDSGCACGFVEVTPAEKALHSTSAAPGGALWVVVAGRGRVVVWKLDCAESVAVYS